MSSAKTTWEDLSRLGWPINEIYKKANAQRGGTMNGHGDLSLNSGIAATYQWWSYNALFGNPYIAGRRPNTISREETAWTYDNTQNSKPHSDEWTEKWTNTTSATVTTASSASITLGSHITIFNVAESGFDITVSTDSSSTESKEQTYELSHTWKMEVGPHEKLSLVRVITTENLVVDYIQEFGIENGSRLGTKGDKYNGHYYWGMQINPLLGNPRGKFNLQGSSRIVTISFKFVREGPNGTTVVKSPVDFHAVDGKVPAMVLRKWAEMEKAALGDTAEVQLMVPGFGEEDSE